MRKPVETGRQTNVLIIFDRGRAALTARRREIEHSEREREREGAIITAYEASLRARARSLWLSMDQKRGRRLLIMTDAICVRDITGRVSLSLPPVR